MLKAQEVSGIPWNFRLRHDFFFFFLNVLIIFFIDRWEIYHIIHWFTIILIIGKVWILHPEEELIIIALEGKEINYYSRIWHRIWRYKGRNLWNCYWIDWSIWNASRNLRYVKPKSCLWRGMEEPFWLRGRNLSNLQGIPKISDNGTWGFWVFFRSIFQKFLRKIQIFNVFSMKIFLGK